MPSPSRVSARSCPEMNRHAFGGRWNPVKPRWLDDEVGISDPPVPEDGCLASRALPLAVNVRRLHARDDEQDMLVGSSFHAHDNGPVNGCAISSQHGYVLSASSNGELAGWRIGTWERIFSIQAHRSGILDGPFWAAHWSAARRPAQ
jgi:hypothetical protein